MQAPDTKPGFYYVTARDGGRTALLVGPFEDDHAQALALVDAGRRAAEEVDSRAVFWWFGTCRSDTDLGPGKLNAKLGLVHPDHQPEAGEWDPWAVVA